MRIDSMRTRLLFGCFFWLMAMTPLAHAQTTALPTIPPAYQLNGVQHYYQTWNNCGPATLSMALSYYGYTDDQAVAAAWLKPNAEDKNVSPWQMAEYVNTQLPGTLRAIIREGGTLEGVKLLISQNFPVIMEAGYDPPNDPQGWMGHYLMIYGYDDSLGILHTMDSFEGPNYPYEYAYIDEFWRHFNRLYIVVYPIEREQELLTLLGSDADETQNRLNALETARLEAVANPEDPFAWFNMGTSFAGLGDYESAAIAYDQSRNVGGGLPWRMLWYQFGPFEAYYNVGRYTDMVALAQSLLNDGGGHLIEETFYYGGLARMGMGETERARSNFDQAVFFNPNFTPARDAIAQLGVSG
jgi:hypothetical protein